MRLPSPKQSKNIMPGLLKLHQSPKEQPRLQHAVLCQQMEQPQQQQAQSNESMT